MKAVIESKAGKAVVLGGLCAALVALGVASARPQAGEEQTPECFGSRYEAHGLDLLTVGLLSGEYSPSECESPRSHAE